MNKHWMSMWTDIRTNWTNERPSEHVWTLRNKRRIIGRTSERANLVMSCPTRIQVRPWKFEDEGALFRPCRTSFPWLIPPSAILLWSPMRLKHPSRNAVPWPAVREQVREYASEWMSKWLNERARNKHPRDRVNKLISDTAQSRAAAANKARPRRQL